jgi:hypothetical protein
MFEHIKTTYHIERLFWESRSHEVTFVHCKPSELSGPLSGLMKGLNAEPIPMFSERFQEKAAGATYVKNRAASWKRHSQQSTSHAKVFPDHGVFLSKTG